MSRRVLPRKTPSPRWRLLATALAALIVVTLMMRPKVARCEDEPDFLVAKPTLEDPLFEQSVILMVPAPAVTLVAGLIINKPTTIPVKRVFPRSIDLPDSSDTVYFGGPVEPEAALMVRRTAAPIASEVHVFGNLYLSVDPKDIATILKDPHLDKTNVRLFLGYSQWGQDQLRAEKMEGSWYEVPAHPEMVFTSTPKALWNELVDRARFLRVNAANETFGRLSGMFDLRPPLPSPGPGEVRTGQ